jgi:hypothetical protein
MRFKKVQQERKPCDSNCNNSTFGKPRGINCGDVGGHALELFGMFVLEPPLIIEFNLGKPRGINCDGVGTCIASIGMFLLKMALTTVSLFIQVLWLYK